MLSEATRRRAAAVTAATAPILFLVLAGTAQFHVLRFGARFGVFPHLSRVSAIIGTAVADQLLSSVNILMLAAALMLTIRLASAPANVPPFSKALRMCCLAHIPLVIWALGALLLTLKMVRTAEPILMATPAAPRIANASIIEFSKQLIALRIGASAVAMAVLGLFVHAECAVPKRRGLAAAFGAALLVFAVGRALAFLG